MPGMTGEEVAREARRRAGGVTLIAMSGVRGEARNIGDTDFDYFLRKPVAVPKYHASGPKWRNWQTRRTQNPVPFGECGFDSHLRHRAS